jgi:hypothetical protein
MNRRVVCTQISFCVTKIMIYIESKGLAWIILWAHPNGMCASLNKKSVNFEKQELKALNGDRITYSWQAQNPIGYAMKISIASQKNVQMHWVNGDERCPCGGCAEFCGAWCSCG